ncbi:unnamed protein product [Rotaria socialis]
MVYQDVMAGKQCHNASDFVALIRDKKTSIIVDELLISDIEAAHEYLTSLFQDVKAVPSIQKTKISWKKPSNFVNDKYGVQVIGSIPEKIIHTLQHNSLSKALKYIQHG